MQRLGVVVLHRDEHAVLHGLGDLGAVHLVRQPSGPETAPHEPPDRTAEMARCGDLLARIETLQSRLEIAAVPPPSAALAEMRLDEAADCLKTLEARASEVLGRRQTVQEQWGQAADLLAQAAAYEGLGLPMHEFGGASFLHFATGSLPAENLEDLQKQLGDNVVLLALPEREGRRHVIAVTSRKGRYALDASLGRVGFRQDALTLAEGESVDHFAGRTRAERDQAAGELDDAAEEVRAIAQDLAPVLANLQYVVSTERMILEAEQNFPHTESTVLISGWVPAADAVGVHRRLLEITSGRCAIESADPKGVPDQEIPVLLRHSRLVRPFLMLLENYGLPTYREIEPTLIMAVSWVIMFGMMFGDAGNGAVVALVGAWLMIKGRTLTMRDGGLLLLLAGLSSVGFGIFYGSYFGITEAGGRELGHDPLKGFAIHLMLAAVALGILLMSIGLALNIINRLRRGDVLGALLGKFGVAGVAFYWGCLGIGGYVAMRGAGPPWWAVLLIIGTPLMAVALRAPLHVLMARRRGEHEVGRAVGSLSEAVIEAFVEVFEAILGYTANTISFVRLAAYAMSHAAVLMASFAMGDQLAHGVPGGGGEVLRIVFIVLGNAVAILLEGLVASVQALRLEYYEFFGKFFSGAGRAFKPFRLPVKAQGFSPRQ
jgi:V/A-type H+-transporting ATPase subunit I